MRLVPDAVVSTVARNALLLQKNSPGILFGVGVAGMVGSTVLACRATLKMDEVLEDAQKRLEAVKTFQDDSYTENGRQHDINIVRVQTGAKIARLYAPAIIVGGLSIAALTKSHHILNNRNAALTAAYTVLEKGFAQYRARVVDKYGEDQDRDFRYGTEQVQITDPKTNRKKMVTRVGPEGASVYAKFFDPTSPYWSKEPEYNLLYIKCQQNHANDLLHARGHVLLNDVYDSLGIERTRAGTVVGWLLNKDGSGDNYISFGVFEGQEQVVRDFVNGREGSILLDFNVDGLIYDKIDQSEGEVQWRLEQ